MYDILGDSKEGDINDCRLIYIVKTENIDLCLNSNFKDSCLLGLAKRLKRQDLCEKISDPKNKLFEQRLIQVCKNNIINNQDNNLFVY